MEITHTRKSGDAVSREARASLLHLEPNLTEKGTDSNTPAMASSVKAREATGVYRHQLVAHPAAQLCAVAENSHCNECGAACDNKVLFTKHSILAPVSYTASDTRRNLQESSLGINKDKYP